MQNASQFWIYSYNKHEIHHGNAVQCPQDANLKKSFDKLTSKQRLVNVLFYKVKLTQAIRLTGVHVLGHALNICDASELTELTTHALVIQVVCYHGGPLYILRVIPVVKL